MKRYNLKLEYNWRGHISEILAKYWLAQNRLRGFIRILGNQGVYRTKGYTFKRIESISKKYNSFLDKNWGSIDLYRITPENTLELYEVKARTAGISRRPDITPVSLMSYKKAKKLGIKCFLVYVYFHDNWEVSFEKIEFKEDSFRVNKGGWYARKE